MDNFKKILTEKLNEKGPSFKTKSIKSGLNKSISKIKTDFGEFESKISSLALRGKRSNNPDVKKVKKVGDLIKDLASAIGDLPIS